METGCHRFPLDTLGKLTSLSLDTATASSLASLFLPLSLFSLFSAARKIPFNVKSDQVNAQLKTHHWFSLRIKLQMVPPKMSYMILQLLFLPHITPPASSATFLHSHGPPSSLNILGALPLQGLSICCSLCLEHFPHRFSWLSPSSLSIFYSNATTVRISLTIFF